MPDFNDLAKKKRVEDWDYLAIIKNTPSIVSGKRSEPHHLDTVGSGGSDYTAVPLTRAEHREIHMEGLKQFEKKHHVNLWRAAHHLFQAYILGKVKDGS